MHSVCRMAALSCLAGSMLLLASCGDAGSIKKMKTFPVSGSVTYNGQPLAKARVAFIPLDTAKYPIERPGAETDKDGKFKLSTYDTGDGAPEGEYKVTIVLRFGEEGSEQGTINLLPAEYERAESTKLQVKISEPKELSPFELKGEDIDKKLQKTYKGKFKRD